VEEETDSTIATFAAGVGEFVGVEVGVGVALGVEVDAAVRVGVAV